MEFYKVNCPTCCKTHQKNVVKTVAKITTVNFFVLMGTKLNFSCTKNFDRLAVDMTPGKRDTINSKCVCVVTTEMTNYV